MLGQIDEKQGKAFFLGHYQNSRIQVLVQNATISPHLGEKKEARTGWFQTRRGRYVLVQELQTSPDTKSSTPSNTINK